MKIRGTLIRGTLLFWTDVVIALTFSALIATGSIMRWVLPPGSGGGGGAWGGGGWRGGRGPGPGAASAAHSQGKTLWDMTRHEWGDVHFWIAASLAGLIVFHLALHWGWLKSNTWNCLLSPVLQRCRLGTCAQR